LIENINENDYVRFGPLNNDYLSADMSQINVPLRVIFGADDDFCVRADQQRFVDLAPTLDGEVEMEGKGHFYFGGANDADFKSALDSLLVNQGKRISKRNYSRDFRW